MKRYDLIDTIRGLSVISMIAFHACWLINFFGLGITTQTLYGPTFTLWERSICISFIAVSGFSFSLGHNHLRSGLVLTGIGALITAVTCLFLPDLRIVFGILTFLGFSVLIMIPIDRLIREKTLGSVAGSCAFICSFILFLFTYGINKGYIGWGIDLPKSLYRGYVSTFIGFMKPGFVSADYFSVIPWFFTYLCGYFIHKATVGTKAERLLGYGIHPVSVIGRHSLAIYLIHPVIIYLLLYCVAVWGS